MLASGHQMFLDGLAFHSNGLGSGLSGFCSSVFDFEFYLCHDALILL